MLARHRIPGAFWWAVVNPPAWALGWLVSSYVITRNVKEHFPVLGAGGAIVYALLTWLMLAFLSVEWSLSARYLSAIAMEVQRYDVVVVGGGAAG